MLLRLAVAVSLGAALLATEIRPAVSQGFEIDEKREMLAGGTPNSRRFQLFGGFTQEIPRRTVSLASAERPGTIIISTGERRLSRTRHRETRETYPPTIGRWCRA